MPRKTLVDLFPTNEGLILFTNENVFLWPRGGKIKYENCACCVSHIAIRIFKQIHIFNILKNSFKISLPFSKKTFPPGRNNQISRNPKYDSQQKP